MDLLFFFGDYPGSLIILGDEAQLVNLLKSNVVFCLFEIDGGNSFGSRR